MPFLHESSVKKHVTTVHDNRRENVDCDICGKSFIDKYSLNYHVKTVHLKKGLAKCDSCDKEFTHSSGLRKHISMIHENPRMKAIKCSFCEKKLLKNSMDYHIRFVHNKEQNNEKCYKCDRKFAKRGILNRHVRLVHDKEKNHVTIATWDFWGKPNPANKLASKTKKKIILPQLSLEIQINRYPSTFYLVF